MSDFGTSRSIIELSEKIDVFKAFEYNFKTLCLDEFPCGYGPWRYDFGIKKNDFTHQEKLNSNYFVTLKDHSPKVEKNETLQDLICSKNSPWEKEYGWTNEAKELRKLAVKTPLVVDKNFVYDYLKSLRLLDESIGDVDKQLLKFTNLDELTLSANYILGLDSRFLPRKLKVLELCANEISDLSGFITDPPLLVHLGLGYNQISHIGDYLSGTYWPNLLSLDLSHNNLTNLTGITEKLKSLPKLKNLILQGNPLSLVAGYRGYTLDYLHHLDIFDDIRITADERHRFRNLSKLPDLNHDEAKIILHVPYISGIPCPDEIRNPDDFPEYPKIERKYWAEFHFIKDITYADSLPLDQSVHMTDIDDGRTPESDMPAIHEKATNLYTPESPNREVVGNDEFLPQKFPDISPTNATDSYTASGAQEGKIRSSEGTLEIIKTQAVSWQYDLISLQWEEVVKRHDLLSLRNFLRTAMKINIVEEKVLGYPPEETSSPPDSARHQKGKDHKTAKDNRKGNDEKKKKPDSSKSFKDDPKAKGKDKKKKKGIEEHLVRSLPEYSILATFDLDLQRFLYGEHRVEQVFEKSIEVPEIISEPPTKEKKEKKKQSPQQKKNDIPGGKGKKDLNIKKSPKASPKNKGKKVKAFAEEEGVVPILKIKVVVSLHHWLTAAESVKDKENSPTT